MTPACSAKTTDWTLTKQQTLADAIELIVSTVFNMLA